MISFIESLTQIPAQINCIEFSNHSRPFIYDYYNDLAMVIQTTLTSPFTLQLFSILLSFLRVFIIIYIVRAYLFYYNLSR